jgi:hypothetical protein
MEESRMRIKHGLLLALVALVAWPAFSGATTPDPPFARTALASCDAHSNQASAQRAKDTRDADGDGVYCVIYSG